MKRLIIEQLKEGFLFSDDDGDKYAIPITQLSIRVKAFFGLTKIEPKRERNSRVPPVVTGKDARQCPETQGNKTADSHSAGTALPSSSTEHEGSNPASGVNKGTQSRQMSEPTTPILSETGLGTPDNYILQPSNLKFPKFEYDPAQLQNYKSLRFQELSNGKVVLVYSGSHYYSSKELVMRIPYPFPKDYFSKKNGWSSSVELAFKLYRRYLFEKGQKQQVEKERREDPDDWKYKPLGINKTRVDREDYTKIEGDLNG